jgi:chromosome segregation ATPase
VIDKLLKAGLPYLSGALLLLIAGLGFAWYHASSGLKLAQSQAQTQAAELKGKSERIGALELQLTSAQETAAENQKELLALQSKHRDLSGRFTDLEKAKAAAAAHNAQTIKEMMEKFDNENDSCAHLPMPDHVIRMLNNAATSAKRSVHRQN